MGVLLLVKPDSPIFLHYQPVEASPGLESVEVGLIWSD